MLSVETNADMIADPILPEFDRLPGGHIQRVTLLGNTIEIATRLWPEDEHNPEIRMAVDNEARLMRDLFGDEMDTE